MNTAETARVEEGSDPWKACDLRGVYPHPVSNNLFRTVGSAIGSMLKADARALVAGDFRLSTSALKEALASGLTSTGVAGMDGGEMPTPVAYFAGEHAAADAVLMVTASHNPADHNGLTLMIGGVPTTIAQLAEIRRIAESGEFRAGNGACVEVGLVALYERSMIERWRHLEPSFFPCPILHAGDRAWSGP